jgi:diguanylate cyclase (GGDEF)-like protein
MTGPSTPLAADPVAGPQACGRRLSPRLLPGRLALRILAAFVGLLLLTQAASLFLLRTDTEAHERARIERALQLAEGALQARMAQQQDRLLGSAHRAAQVRILPPSGDLQEASLSGIDRATLLEALQEGVTRVCQVSGAAGQTRSERCEAGAQAAVFDDALRVLGSLQGRHARLQSLAAMLRPQDGIDPCPRSDGSAARSAVLPQAGLLMQYVLVPRCSPELSGWVLMGVAVDQGFAEEFALLAGVQVQLLARDGPGLPWASPAGTLSPATAGALLQGLGAALPTRVLSARNEEYLMRSAPLASGPQGEAVALLALSLDEAMGPSRAMQRALVGLTLVALVAGAGVAVILARGITRPLGQLVHALRVIQDGRYDQAVRLAPRSDEIGTVAAAVELARQGIARRSAELAYKAFHDELTGLANRVSFFEVVRAQVERHPEQPCAVLLMAVNRFTVIQEALGPSCGDGVLREVARRLRERIAVRQDVVARVGDHQFALLLPQAGTDAAQKACDEIRVALIQPLQIGGHTVDAEVTCGIACWPQHAPALEFETPEALRHGAEMLVSHAELAMYFARDQVLPHAVYAAELDPDAADTLSLKTALTQAIRNHELRLFLQPTLCLRTRRLIGAEALVRWQRGSELVPPMKFIPFAEDTGFVRELTKWVFEEAVRHWPALQAMGLQRVAVNLSPRDLMPELPQVLGNVLARYGVPASVFCLEITETAIMNNPRRAQEVLLALAMAGFRLAIDDYGAGATSLQYLKRLPVHELKIDRGYIHGIEEDSKDGKIVRSTIGLAHSLGLEVVAEGVETTDALELVAGMGADHAQGFLLSRPLPVAEMAALMQRWQSHPPAAFSRAAADVPQA